MEKKKCLNPDCGELFAPNSGKQKFCSDRCKVAYSRQKGTTSQKVEKLKKSIPGLKTADQIKPPRYKKPDVVIETGYGERFLDICKLKKANPEDMLVWIEENYGKKQSLKSAFGKKEKDTSAPRGGSLYLEQRRKMKSAK